MNKTAIKNYAIRARVQLIEAVKQRAYEYEITEDGENKSGLQTVGDRLLTPDEIKQREQLIEEIRHKGYNQVMEEAAYTWFNRFIALRFMEVNGFLPSRVRVFTDESGAFKPEILKEAMTVDIDGLDRNKVFDLLDRQENEELFKYLIITQCNALNQGLPYMFEKISNWTELLFPANLLRSDSVIGSMISDIPEDNWQDAVQIIGWMYQYYNTELKDDTFARLKKNIKISKERIPAATQLFTPDWIVRYMVENSLGRLWYEGHPYFDKSEWRYYLDEAEQEPEVEQQLQKIRAEYADIKPEDIKLIDPCMGSGHILVYAFDVLLQIYTSCGWSERDAAKSIIENNIYGLDIDDRAGQLAYFAIMMKARKHNRRILNGETRPNILAIQDSGFMSDDFIAYVAGKDMHMKADLTLLRSSLKDAKEYGSILNVPVLNYAELYERIDIISRSFAEDLFQAQYQTMAVEKLLPLVNQAEIMAQKYDVVVTNPPYMGTSNMSSLLRDHIKSHYATGRYDLFAVFIEKLSKSIDNNGFLAMITQQTWMFQSGYENLRNKLKGMQFSSLLHLGPRAFEEISGEVVQTVAFILTKQQLNQYCGTYCRLVNGKSEDEKHQLFFNAQNRFYSKQDTFDQLPGAVIAYWVPYSIAKEFVNNKPMSYLVRSSYGLLTGDNERYLRMWHEVVNRDIRCDGDFSSDGKWAPCNMGGSYRKWFSMPDNVVIWGENGVHMKMSPKAAIPDDTFLFKESVAWNDISTSTFAVRYIDSGIIGGHTCPAIFADHNSLLYYLAFMTTKVTAFFLAFLSPTMHNNTGDVLKMPVIRCPEQEMHIVGLSDSNVNLSRTDWNAFETSWNFKKHPLV